jgi:hypothetical protein
MPLLLLLLVERVDLIARSAFGLRGAKIIFVLCE